MAARGAVSKERVAQKILETFPGAFPYEKEIRVPMVEDGETIQIKITLTAAKVNVESGGDVVMPAATVASTPVEAKPMATVTQPSAEEKKTVADLMAKLGL